MQFILIYRASGPKGLRRGVGVTTLAKALKAFYETTKSVTMIEESRGTVNRLAEGDRSALQKYCGRDDLYIIEGPSKEICVKAMTNLNPKWNTCDVQYIEVNGTKMGVQ